MEEKMIMNLMNRLLETTARAVEAETLLKSTRTELEALQQKFTALEAEHKTTEGAYNYECKENSRLRAELKAYEEKQAEDESYHTKGTNPKVLPSGVVPA